MGYGQVYDLSNDDKYINEKIIPTIEDMWDRNDNISNMLLTLSGDQVKIEEDLPRIIESLNKKTKYEFIISSIPNFFKALSKEEKDNLKICRSEYKELKYG